jgi:hypothetical protein
MKEPMSDHEWAARLVRSAQRPAPLSAGELQAIGARLERPPTPPRARLAWRVALAVTLLLCGGALTAGAARLLRVSPFVEWPPVQPATSTSPPMRSRPPTLVAPAAPEAALTPTAEPAARPRRAARPAPPATAIEEPAAPTPEATPPSALHEEAAILSGALRRLREENDAAGALALLDEHDRRFGDTGPLADEARATRVEAWLKTGKRALALSALEPLMLRPWGRGRALRAARADLRAEAGRCNEAIVDFDALLAGDTSDAITERALFGRASCRAAAGDAAASRADLERYLSRFPSGAYATRARAALTR